jgi:regulator of protease activity HflC (stomatin/prohibitin superfamily)
MEFALVIIALLAFLALAFWIRVKRLRKSAAGIVEKFRQHGAIRENRARTLAEMGFHSKPRYPFLVRDQQVEALSQLLRQGVICQAKPGSEDQEARFYLDEQKYPTL